MEYMIFSLIILLIAQQWFWMKHTQKLVDKLMSRSYFDYESAKIKPDKKKNKPQPQIETPMPQEDFGALEQFQVI